jgi:hypothetical protein
MTKPPKINISYEWKKNSNWKFISKFKLVKQKLNAIVFIFRNEVQGLIGIKHSLLGGTLTGL